jgi:integrase
MPGKSAPLLKTKTPSIYRRGENGPYVVAYRSPDGKQRRESARTYEEARLLKARRMGEIASGEYVKASRETLNAYAQRWLTTYRGRNGDLRATTLAEYERDLRRYVLPRLGRSRLTALRPRHVQDFVAWLADDDAQRRRWTDENRDREHSGQRPVRCPVPLADGTIGRIVAALKAVLSTAVREEVVARNVASGVVLPRRDHATLPEDDDDAETNVRALTREQVHALLVVVNPEWRTFFRLLAATGLRISEALAIEARHLRLDGSRPVVRVRQAWTPRGGLQLPKSRHGRRDVPLPRDLVDDLRAHLAARIPDASPRSKTLVFASTVGTYQDPENLRRRVLAPAAQEADCAWAGFHAFRHFFASVHIERGTNILQLSRLLGHHKPSFTLDVYGSLMDAGTGDALDLAVELAPYALIHAAQPEAVERS